GGVLGETTQTVSKTVDDVEEAVSGQDHSKHDKNSPKISADDSDQQGSKSPASENSQGLVGKVLTEPTHVVTETVDHVEKAVSSLDASDKTDGDTSLNKGADTNRKPQSYPTRHSSAIGGVLGETTQTVSKTVDDVEEAVSGQDH